MAKFDPVYQWCLLKEGQQLENVSGDSGGLTWCGISQNNNPTWEGWSQISIYLLQSGRDVVRATPLCLADENLMNETQEFYQDSFTKHNMQDLSYQELALQVFYHYWNMGGIALTAFQAIVGVVPDGLIGPETIMRANSAPDQSKLVDIFLAWCKQHYLDIVTRHPEDEKFIHGWENTCLRSDGK